MADSVIVVCIVSQVVLQVQVQRLRVRGALPQSRFGALVHMRVRRQMSRAFQCHSVCVQVFDVSVAHVLVTVETAHSVD